jgi:hypothetical protein
LERSQKYACLHRVMIRSLATLTYIVAVLPILVHVGIFEPCGIMNHRHLVWVQTCKYRKIAFM